MQSNRIIIQLYRVAHFNLIDLEVDFQGYFKVYFIFLNRNPYF